jgi:hypothetical protein
MDLILIFARKQRQGGADYPDPRQAESKDLHGIMVCQGR